MAKILNASPIVNFIYMMVCSKWYISMQWEC